jgi:prepilin-type N-terminal cleavage/methylation domain-containing protein
MLKQATSHKPQATSHKPQATSHKPQAFRLGFTLSELLVSLAVLGLIAGLTVPSVINSIETVKKRALAKEALQIITDITSAGVLNGDFSTITSWDTVNQNGPTSITGYLTSKLNARQCVTSDITSPGCTLGWTGFPANGVDNQHKKLRNKGTQGRAMSVFC